MQPKADLRNNRDPEACVDKIDDNLALSTMQRSKLNCNSTIKSDGFGLTSLSELTNKASQFKRDGFVQMWCSLHTCCSIKTLQFVFYSVTWLL